MKRIKKAFFATAVACIAVTGIAGTTASAHCGGGGCYGGYGGYRGYSTSSSYYYCGGQAGHYHNGGYCPYYGYNYNNIPSNTNSSSGNSSNGSSENSSNSSSGGFITVSAKSTQGNSTVKKVQKELNNLGYSCGTADGILGSKTKNAIKHFQVDYGLEVNGKVTSEVKRALNL